MQPHHVATESEQILSNGPHGFHLTLLEQAPLTDRLNHELRFFASRAKLEWQYFVSSPSQQIKRRSLDLRRLVVSWIQAPNRAAAVLSAFTLVFTAALLVIVLDARRLIKTSTGENDEAIDEVVTMLPVLNAQQSGSTAGFAPNSKGRVGLARGTGEGSNIEPKPAHGGGRGGDGSRSPAQNGAVPLPSEIPAPIPPVALKNPSLPEAGIKIDPLLWKALPVAHYGDPLSDSQVKSNGPGTGGGIGDGDGVGIGDGRGPGLGPGEDGNTGTGSNQPGSGGIGGGPRCGAPSCFGTRSGQIFPLKDVTVRARVLSKPEPHYTEEARRNQITGTVSLRVVFSRTGEVINIRAIHTLPFGLTERAIAAARQIRFIPAQRHGQAVSVHMQLEYNFNLY